jgi:hypothetical protein
MTMGIGHGGSAAERFLELDQREAFDIDRSGAAWEIPAVRPTLVVESQTDHGLSVGRWS